MSIAELAAQILDKPWASMAVVFNLVLIESLLSVDNAAVLATMVLDLNKEERGKALRYGIIGAYIFRGICLFFAAFLIKIWWLKPIAGLYLLYLSVKHFIVHKSKKQEAEEVKQKGSWIYRQVVKVTGPFWATVFMVEVMDMAFSLDNVFAAVAFTNNILLVWAGVFIGILAMRFVAQIFVRLLTHYPFLEMSAFIVLGILGLKLALSLSSHYLPGSRLDQVISGHNADIFTSAVTVLIFVVPVLGCVFFNYPRRR